MNQTNPLEEAVAAAAISAALREAGYGSLTPDAVEAARISMKAALPIIREQAAREERERIGARVETNLSSYHSDASPYQGGYMAARRAALNAIRESTEDTHD